VVTAEQEEVLRILDLVGKKETDGLEWLFASVDVVSEEEVVCLRWEPAVLKESKQVRVLTVNVPCNDTNSQNLSSVHITQSTSIVVFIYIREIA